MTTGKNISGGLTIIIFFISFLSGAQNSYDSLNLKLPKHYFNTVIDLDLYSKPSVPIKDTLRKVSKRLGSYAIRQTYLSFYAPLATKNWTGRDSAFKNSHLLLTANYMSLRPVFEGISTHNLVKFGVGMRYIYNTGKKGVWFLDVSPFVTRDVSFPSKPYYRMASTFIYSHNVTEKFNWRLGITKSFLWGNRFYLPFVGIRIGRLDKVNLSIQIPRSISVNMPFGDRFIFSAYTRPQGGMYNFSNADSLYFRNTEATFHFTRYELNTGLRFDMRVTRHFNFYIATGISSRNNITFYSDRANKTRRNRSYDTYFYAQDLPASLFFNLGLVFRLGKNRSYYNVKNIYDAIDLNNNANGNNGNPQIPLTPRNKSKLNLESVQDLVEYNDF